MRRLQPRCLRWPKLPSASLATWDPRTFSTISLVFSYTGPSVLRPALPLTCQPLTLARDSGGTSSLGGAGVCLLLRPLHVAHDRQHDPYHGHYGRAHRSRGAVHLRASSESKAHHRQPIQDVIPPHGRLCGKQSERIKVNGGMAFRPERYLSGFLSKPLDPSVASLIILLFASLFISRSSLAYNLVQSSNVI